MRLRNFATIVTVVFFCGFMLQFALKPED